MLVAFKYDSDLFLYTCDYAELKRMADDRNKICDTYAEWLVEFSKAVQEIKQQGMEVLPITIKIAELNNWCQKNKLKNTGNNRSKYVVEIVNCQSRS